MRLVTAAWGTVPIRDDVARVGISRGGPRGHPGGYKMYKALAPGPWFNSVSFEEYQRLYRAQLDQLDPDKVLAELTELAKGRPVVALLCFERPPWSETNFCHRRMFADWLGERKGIDVVELDPAAGRLPTCFPLP